MQDTVTITRGNTTAHNFPTREAAEKALNAFAFLCKEPTCESQGIEQFGYCSVVKSDTGLSLERRKK